MLILFSTWSNEKGQFEEKKMKLASKNGTI